jgi:hypothetical protein
MSVEAFRKAAEAKDLESAVDCFADDATLRSPVLFRPFEDKQSIRLVLAAVMKVLEDFRYTDALSSDGKTCLVFRARVRDRELQGIDLVSIGPDGKIADFTVMMRPLSALNAFSAAMAEQPTLLEALARRGA